MKNTLLLLIGFGLITLSSCKNKEKQVSEATETSKIEEVEEVTEKSSEGLIANGKVGEFKIGDPIPETSKNFEIEKSQHTKLTEGGPSEEIIYTVFEKGKEQLILKPQFDPQKNRFNNRIGEIMIISEEYKTNEKIGVNSTIAEFQNAYPNFKIWYTYVSDRYILETPEVAAQFLLKEEDFMGEMEINSVQVPLKPTDFKVGAEINKIRIFR